MDVPEISARCLSRVVERRGDIAVVRTAMT